MRNGQGVGWKGLQGLRWQISVCFAISLFFVLFGRTSSAQTINGQITGIVTDPTGAVIVGAQVTLTYPLTGQQRTVQAGSSGEFLFPDLVPGRPTHAGPQDLGKRMPGLLRRNRKGWQQRHRLWFRKGAR